MFGRVDGHHVRVFLRERLLAHSQHAQRRGQTEAKEAALFYKKEQKKRETGIEETGRKRNNCIKLLLFPYL